MLIKRVFILLLLSVHIFSSECLVFKKTNLDLYHPAVSGETVNFDCTTDVPHAELRLVRKDQKTGTETLLQPDDLRLRLDGQVYTILITDERDDGEYICRARSDGVTVQKSKFIFIGAKDLFSSVSGGVPTKPVIRKFSTLVQEGRRFVIECTTKWYFAKLTWTKDNNTRLPSSWVTQQKPDYENGNIIVVSTLTIDGMKLEDAGTYTCHSTSRSDSSKRSSASVRVNVKAQSLFWLKDSPATYNHIKAVVGASASLSCAMSHPAEKVDFYRIVTGSPPRRISSNTDKYQFINNQELVIRKVSLLDYGTYICRSENYRRDKTIQLFINSNTVDVPYVKLVPPSLHPLDFHESVNITCLTYGINTEIEWLRNTGLGGKQQFERVSSNNDVRRERLDDGTIEQRVKLVIKKAVVADQGKYMCKVSTDKKVTNSKEIDVKVKDPLSPEIKRFSDVKTGENKQVNLICRSKGSPKPNITFFKDGVEITSKSPGYEVVGRKLTITSAKFPDNDGLYSCNVTNRFGRASATAKLMVTVPPMINKSSNIIVVSEMEKLKATCNVLQSNPIPTITWQYQTWPCHDHGFRCQPLPLKWRNATSPHVQPADGKPTMESTFLLPKSSVRRFFIRCFANHLYGKDVHNMIAVIDKRDAQKNLHSTPTTVEPDEGQSFELKCTGAAGLFVRLSWYKDSKEIIPNNSSISIFTNGTFLEERVSILMIKNVRPEHAGNYTCVAELTRSQQKPISAVSFVSVKKIYRPKIISYETSAILDGETALLKCVVDGYPAVSVKWYKDGVLVHQKVRKLASLEDCTSAAEGSYFELGNETDVNNGRRTYGLVICKASWKKNNGTYTCNASNTLGVSSDQRHQFVYATPRMRIVETNRYLDYGSDYSTNCSVEGNPTPYMWWEKLTADGSYQLVTENSTSGLSWLNLTSMKREYGTYRCVAVNAFGRVEEKMTLRKTAVIRLKGDDPTTTAYLITSVIAAIIIITIISIFAVILFRRKRLYGGFYILSIPPPPDYFRTLDPSKPISEQVHKLPYFPEWEFPREKVQMKKCVGSGAFGEVYVADAIGIVDFDPRYKLSLKHKPLFSKGRFSFSYFQKSVKRASMDGNSETTKSKKGGKGKAVLVAVKKLKEDATTVEYKDLISEMKILIHIGQQENIVNLLAACTKGMEKDTMVILEFCTHGNLLSFMKGRRQIFKPIWSKQHIGMEHEFTTFDLCVAAYQISKGLDFLASRKCVHRDVAARNVLVADNYIMKVADFGLARDVYHDEVYVKQTGGLLPFKWMAIESIVDRVFTHQSDVWAYGVLLWELMTLGGSPYPGIDHQYLSEYLHTGNRMDQPQFCPNEIYLLMRDCWKPDPSERPTFDSIVMRLARVIEYHCTSPEMVTHYLDKAHISGGSITQPDDYLKPVDGGPAGSYKFSPPPTYSQSFEDRRLDSDSGADRSNIFQRQPSERYVPERRFVENNASSEVPVDSSTKEVDEAVFESLDMEDGTRAYINEPSEDLSYVNGNRLPSIDEEHRVLVTDQENEHDTDETTALLIDNNQSSVNMNSDTVTYNNISPSKNNNNNNINNNNNNIESCNDMKYEQMNGDMPYVNEPSICYVNDGV